jgi:hypothetical protein
MKNQTNAPVDRTRNPVPSQPAGDANVVIHRPVPLFQPREIDRTEGDKDSFGDA